MSLPSTRFALRAIALATTLALSSRAGATTIATTTGNATIQGSPIAPTATSGISAVVIPASQIGLSTSFSVNSGAQQVNVSFAGGGAVESTPNTSNYAAPVSGSTGAVATPFFATNSTSGGPGGSYTLSFATVQSYLGLLWGSIGTGDLLTFYAGANQTGGVVATVNGTTAATAGTNYNPANGAQNYGGSQYELINFLNGTTFQSVTFSQTLQAAFESADIQYAARNVNAVPEPGSVLLVAVGLAGVFAARRRRADVA